MQNWEVLLALEERLRALLHDKLAFDIKLPTGFSYEGVTRDNVECAALRLLCVAKFLQDHMSHDARRCDECRNLMQRWRDYFERDARRFVEDHLELIAQYNLNKGPIR